MMRPVKNQTDFAQKHRPQVLEDVVLHDHTRKQLIKIRDEGVGLSLLFHGSPGTGKTTTARLINPNGNFQINCSKDNDVDTIKRLMDRQCTSPLIEGGLRVVIFDEADELTDKAQKALRGIIEELSSANMFVFTCNWPEKLIAPLHSRLHAISFAYPKGDASITQQMVDRAMAVIGYEGIQMDKAVVKIIVSECYPDMRRVLKRIQAESLFN